MTTGRMPAGWPAAGRMTVAARRPATQAPASPRGSLGGRGVADRAGAGPW